MNVTSRSPRARLERMRATNPRWLLDYALWKYDRLEDRLPRDTEKRLRPLRRDLGPALIEITGASEGEVNTLRAEFATLHQQQAGSTALYGVADTNLTELEYVVVRSMRPAVVVETGVWRGLSSWTLLAALDANGFGELVSIDFPPLDPSQQVEVGHLVPEELRSRWALELGPSRQLLPLVVGRVPSVDVFIHDSDHTTANMSREFRVAWQAMAPGGALLSDDIEANHAFVRFARRVHSTPVVVPKMRRSGYLGMLRKA